MINSDSIHEMLMQDCQLQSISEPSSATPSLQRHPHHNSTWVPEDYSTINNKQYFNHFDNFVNVDHFDNVHVQKQNDLLIDR